MPASAARLTMPATVVDFPPPVVPRIAVWRGSTSEEYARTLAQIDPHSPRKARVHGPLSNLDAFQEAFDLPDDAPVMRPRAERIEIW